MPAFSGPAVSADVLLGGAFGRLAAAEAAEAAAATFVGAEAVGTGTTAAGTTGASTLPATRDAGERSVTDSPTADAAGVTTAMAGFGDSAAEADAVGGTALPAGATATPSLPLRANCQKAMPATTRTTTSNATRPTFEPDRAETAPVSLALTPSGSGS